MTTTQHTRTVDRSRPRTRLRRAATIVGWLFVVTYVTSIAAKIGLYPPLFDGNYVTGPGQDSRVLWGAFSEAILIIANIGTATALYTVIKRPHPNLAISFVAARIMESRLHRCRHPRRPHRRHAASGLRRRRRRSPRPAWPPSGTRSSSCRSGPSTSAPRSSSASATAASSAG